MDRCLLVTFCGLAQAESTGPRPVSAGAPPGSAPAVVGSGSGLFEWRLFWGLDGTLSERTMLSITKRF